MDKEKRKSPQNRIARIRFGAKSATALVTSQIPVDSVKPWTDLTAHCGYFFVPSLPRGLIAIAKAAVAALAEYNMECTEDFFFSTQVARGNCILQ